MKKSPFPQCRHAGNVRGELTRACNSPKLWGLKIVSSSQCDNCYCRDHIDDDSDLNNRQSPCAFCGPEKPVATATLNNGHSEDGRYFACHHPEHDFASSETCQSCGDYLYPIMTPKTPIDVAKKLMQSPYRHQPAGWSDWDNVRKSFHQLTNEAIRQTPGDFSWTQERGIVIVGGGRYFDSTYVTINVIRRLGCTLPIEVWHLDGEINDHHRLLLQPYDVDFRNADRDPQSQSFRFLNGNWWKGWQLKSCALRYCSFKEVLLLDSDCYPVRNPEYLFDWERFREWGAVFWPDLDMNRGLIKTEAWSVFQVPPLDGLPTESGQILINRETCQRELHLACHFNQHADFVYNIIYGDKDTFPIAWHRLGRRYARMWPSSEFDSVAIKQFDFNGHVAFLHRVHDKFRCNGTLFDGTPQQYQENQYHDHFPLESYCFAVLDELRARKLSVIPRQSEIDLSPPTSIEEMYPPVWVADLVSNETQEEFARIFVESGVFTDDPFDFEEGILRPQENCVSASLFKQNANNRYKNEFEVDEAGWHSKYWLGLEMIAKEIRHFPEWKLRLYVESQLWDEVVNEFQANPQIELFRMQTDSIGADPGALWRFLALSDKRLRHVLVTDIDESLLPKRSRMETFIANREIAVGRFGGFSDPKNYIVDKAHSDSKNYATMIASSVMSRPELVEFDLAQAIKGFMVHRVKHSRTERPWSYSETDKLNAYNVTVGHHVYGWGSHWFMYGFDERFLKHVLYYHFANNQNLLTWASTLTPDQMNPEGLCDYHYVTERGNLCII